MNKTVKGIQHEPRQRASRWLVAIALGAALPALVHGQATPPTPPNTGDALMDSFGLTSKNTVQTAKAQAASTRVPADYLKVRPQKGDTTYIVAAFPAASDNTLSVFTGYDGKNFTSLASEVYRPPGGLLRDPSIIHAADGDYYVAYTTGLSGNTFGVARSKDLRHWRHVSDIALALPAAAGQAAPSPVTNVRAPEWFRDRDGKLHIVVSASRSGKDGAFASYVLDALDEGLARFSAPQVMKGLDNNTIDTFPVIDGDVYRVFTRNQATKQIDMASALELAGPWTIEKSGDWAGWGANLEAPALVKLKDGAWRIYLEDATSKHYYYSDSSDHFKTWTLRAEVGALSGTARHFTVLAEPSAVVDAATAPTSKPKNVTWDKHSLLIDGKRTMIWAGEMHPFRLPSPSLWRDVLQKMKASGLNTVAYYFDWGYHSARPGEYDFSGVRNMERAIEMAEEAGLYVIIRVGPYVNGELTMGGFPGWLARQKSVARTDAPEYIAAADEWLTQIDAIVARHQITTGGGRVILYQLENELSQTSDAHKRYMQHLADKARADGISVPLFHNSAGRLPNWTPVDSSAPYAVPGPTDLYAFDGYPGGGCTNTHTPGKPNVVPNWGMYGELPAKITGPVKIGALASPNTPGFAAEIGGGWFDFWGSVGSYECTAQRIGSSYQRVFYGASLINGLSIHSVYMMFGGTSWGWEPASVVYTSYDYGAGIDEARGLREKALTLKQMGQFVAAAQDLLSEMDKAEPLASSNARIKLYHNISPRSQARLIFAIHNPSDATTNDPFSFRLTTRDGNYAIPQSGSLALNGHDAKLLLADYELERHHLVYTTSDTQTHFRQGARDIALLYGRSGEDGETVLRYAIAPKVEVLEGAVTAVYDAKSGDLRLNYVHKGLSVVRITPAADTDAPLLLLLADDDTGRAMWKLNTAQGPLLLRSKALLRSANWEQDTLALKGDTSDVSAIDVWSDRAITALRFNGQDVTLAAGADGRVAAGGILGPERFSLPDLMALPWVRRLDSPESAPGFDDSAWRDADLTSSAATIATTAPAGQPVLTMSDYGFHHGDVWYRGRFQVGAGHAAPDQLEIAYGGGGAGMMQVWLDGKFIGQHELPVGVAMPVTFASATFGLASASLLAGPHLLSIMVRNNSHNWDLAANDEHKEGRGLISVSLGARQGPKFATQVAWKIQGNQGGETIADLLRGPMNNGGLWGERQGWYLPVAASKADAQWQSAVPTAPPPQAGTYWLRTNVKLDLPKNHDIQLGLVFGDPSKARSSPKTRVLMFINGWNMGNFISHVGPQRTFILPPGILNANGDNTIALAVTTDGQPENALEPVKLVSLRAVRGGVGVEPVGQARSLQR